MYLGDSNKDSMYTQLNIHTELQVSCSKQTDFFYSLKEHCATETFSGIHLKKSDNFQEELRENHRRQLTLYCLK